MKETEKHNERMATMTFASVYPHYVTKVGKKGRTREELHEVIEWLTGFDQTQRTGTVGHHMARGDQLLDQGLGQDDDIAGRAAQQFVAHHAHRAEGPFNAAASGLFELGLNALDHGCGCAATQYMHAVLSVD